MKKRFSFLTMLGLTAVLLTLMGVISALAAPSAAVDGTIVLDKGFYSITGTDPALGSPGSTATVTITDKDLDVAGEDKTFTVLLDGTAAGTGQLFTLPDSNIVGSPVVAPTSTPTRLGAFTTAQATASINNSPQGKVIVQTGTGGPAAGTSVVIIYNVGTVNTVPIRLTSSADSSNPITIIGTETALDSGVFKGTVILTNAASGVGLLRATDGGSITAAYTDTDTTAGTGAVPRSATASTEIGKPVFSNLSPTNRTRTQVSRPTFSGTISDQGASGINITSIALMIDGDANGSLETTVNTGNGLIVTPNVNGSSSVTFTFTPTADFAVIEGNHNWQVTAADIAGNVGTSDSDSTTSTANAQNLTIDKTVTQMASGRTGRFWDTGLATPAIGSGTRNTSIIVIFNDELDATSVSAADFTVNGVAPSEANVYTGALTSTFLTVAAQSPDAAPVIALVGEIKDRAGNITNAANASPATVTAVDGLAPGFTVTMDKTIIKADQDLTISISVNEAIAGSPTVTIYGVDVAWGIGTAPTSAAIAPQQLTANSWKAVVRNPGGAFNSPDASKKSAIRVTGSDLAVPANAGSTGVTDTASASSRTFIFDTTAPSISRVTAGGKTVCDVNAVPAIACGSTTTSSVDVPTTAPFVGVTFNEVVSVTVAQFGSGSSLADVTSKGQLSTDGKTFTYAATGLTAGSTYTIRTTAQDTAGNKTSDQSRAFRIIARPTFDLQLKPGMNLVSLTNDPQDTGINAIMGSADVNSVVTYDPLNPSTSTGPWLTATRGADGKFTGNLATIDAKHAYWVNGGSFSVLKVNIPDTGFTVTPPSIAVVAGWNLVPVNSLTITSLTAGAVVTISADRYFASLPNWITAYTFDPATNVWTKLVPKNFPSDNVLVGSGYWLYTTTSGILVP